MTKRYFISSILISVFLSFINTNAQFDIFDKAEKELEKEVEKQIKSSDDDTLESEADKSIENDEIDTKESKSVKVDNSAELKAWTKFDFVPGDEIIFLDELVGEENGEFPSRWDLKEGNVEIAKLGEDYTINFATTQNCYITPLMSEYGDYLPEKFTLEFDAYFTEFCTKYNIYFWDMINQKPSSTIPHVNVKPAYVSVEGFSGTDIASRDYPFWEHVAISFNVRALKVYFGEKRVMNIPNLRAEPMGLTISSGQCHPGNQAMIKNIRIAQGSKKLYDRIVSDGKFITSGILFDVNKSSIKPESMGVINEIVKMLNEHKELKLRIEGHTDSDGDEVSNQQLSENRSIAVKEALVSFGIDSSRFETTGFGESKPISENSTPEGKANNRRVEFIKI